MHRWTPLATGLLSVLFFISLLNPTLAKPLERRSTVDRTTSLSHGPVADTIAFEDLFSHVRSIPIEGTKDQPVFVFTDLAVQDSLIVVLNRQSATLTAFSIEGELLYQTGRPGEGPGEFTNPYWIGFDTHGRITVLEGSSNYRVQFLSADSGSHIDVVTNTVVPAFWSGAYIMEVSNNQHLSFVTDIPCSEGDNVDRYCLIQEHNLTSGEVVRKFAPKQEVQPGARSVPWVMGMDDSGKYYVAHNSGSHIAIYSQNGSYLERIRIDDIPDYKSLDYSSLPEDDFEAAKVAATMGHSNLRSISIVNSDIIIDHLQVTSRDNDPMFVSILSKNGKHKATISDVSEMKRKLIKVQDDRFFFLETDLSSEVGSYVVHEYRYEGLDD